MKLIEAKQLAESLMGRYCPPGWTFTFSNSKLQLGLCHYGKRQISLSRSYVQLNEADCIRDTILHEIAHSLTPGARHGIVWKLKCIELGCRPIARKSSRDVKLAPFNWQLICHGCGKQVGVSYRRRKVDRYRSTCCGATLSQQPYAEAAHAAFT